MTAETTFRQSLLPTMLASSLFMDLLDTAALGTALPSMAKEFNTDPLELKLALTAYLVTVAILVPASGWIADRFGARRVFCIAMSLFLAGSVCCGLSASVEQLVAARVLQGVGGAMMTPIARIILIAATPKERLVQALNAFTFPAVIGPLLGPPLAGLLMSVGSWRWIFFINIPMGLVALLLTRKIVPRVAPRAPGRFDLIGFGTAAIAILALLAVAESAGSHILSTTATLWAAALAAVAITLFVIHTRRVADPILDLRFLQRQTFRASMLGGALGRVGLGATPFIIPLFLQVALGWSPLETGGVMMAQMIGSLAARPVGTYCIRRLGFRSALIGMGLLTGLLTAIPAVFVGVTSSGTIAAVLFGLGLTRASFYVAAIPIGYTEIEPEEVSRASTLGTVIQQLTLGFGVNLTGFLLFMFSGGSALQIEHFSATFVTLGLVVLLAVIPFMRLPPHVGAHMRYGGSVNE